MDTNVENEAVALLSTIIIVAAVSAVGKVKKRRKRREWVSNLLKERDNKGAMDGLIPDLVEQNGTRVRGTFNNFLRMDKQCFEVLLQKVTPLIEKQDTIMRKAISPIQRLGVTLRYLATGASFTELYYHFRISVSSLTSIIPETCEAIYTVLKVDYLTTPTTTDEWLRISRQLNKKSQFPNCLGALDGKHILLQKPWHSSSHYHNYKGTESIVLMALCDAEYKFTYVSVGCNGRVSDGGVYDACSLSTSLEHNTLNIPPPTELPNSRKVLPFVILADEAFPLKTNLMRPYPRNALTLQLKIFNYRLSRLRRLIENAFGILTATWRVFGTKISLQPEAAEKVVLATCVLHNFLRVHDQVTVSANHDTHQGNWRAETGILAPLSRTPRRPPQNAKEVRDAYCNYMNNEGAVPWQDKMVQ